MKRLEELGISPVPWTAGRNLDMATLLDGKEGKVIYAHGSVYEVPYVGFANVVDGDTESAVRNAVLMAEAPNLYGCLYDAVEEKCSNCEYKDKSDRCLFCKVQKWKNALEKASSQV